MEQPKPWKSDHEIEREMKERSLRSRHGQAGAPSQPKATYGLLIAIGIIWVFEWIVALLFDEEVFITLFTIYAPDTWYDWILQPWSPFTSTMSHSITSIGHIFFNGIALYFFGPTIEYVLGRKRFLIFFFGTGALSGIVQASGIIELLIFGRVTPAPALGASGAIMALIGISIILMPKSKLFIFPFPIPIPLWIGGLAFAALDIFGIFNPQGIGNVAHLTGLAIGLIYGLRVKKELDDRGLRLVTA